MSKKEKQILLKIGELIPTMQEEKKEYLAGVMDGIALMSESKPEENEVEGGGILQHPLAWRGKGRVGRKWKHIYFISQRREQDILFKEYTSVKKEGGFFYGHVWG